MTAGGAVERPPYWVIRKGGWGKYLFKVKAAALRQTRRVAWRLIGSRRVRRPFGKGGRDLHFFFVFDTDKNILVIFRRGLLFVFGKQKNWTERQPENWKVLAPFLKGAGGDCVRPNPILRLINASAPGVKQWFPAGRVAVTAANGNYVRNYHFASKPDGRKILIELGQIGLLLYLFISKIINVMLTGEPKI